MANRSSLTSDDIEVPQLLDIPEKLTPLLKDINKYRYFVIDGGRVSGKTQAVARILCWIADQQTARIVCGREIQNTLEESVYAVFADLIKNFNLDFEVLQSKIDHRVTHSSIRFRGLREQGAVNIKGLEGVDIFWNDEAQTTAKQTLDILIPTIRKEKSKFIFTLNRYVEEDPVFVELVTRTDCLHIHLDYRDNPFCPESSKKEAEHCRDKNYEDYRHIWLGEPLSKSSDHLFGIDQLRESIALDMDRIGVRRTILSNDPARMGDCETTFVALQSRGPLMWEMIHSEGYKHKKADETVGRHAALHKDLGTDMHVIDCDGMGGPVADLVDSKEFEIEEFYATKDYETETRNRDRRTEAYYKTLSWIEKGYLKILNDPILIQQLLTIRYKTKPDGTRYIMSKEEMAKGDSTHPPVADIGRADALMMAVWFADTLMGPDFMNSSPTHGKMEIEVEQFAFDKTMPEYGD